MGNISLELQRRLDIAGVKALTEVVEEYFEDAPDKNTIKALAEAFRLGGIMVLEEVLNDKD